MASFERSIDARSTDAERLGDGCGAKTLRFHLAYPGRVYRSGSAFAVIGHWSKFGSVREWPQEGNDVRHNVLALLIAALATPAYAQLGPNLGGGDIRINPKTDAEVRQEQEREFGYRSGVSKIPDAKAKSDPWAGVRGAAPAPGQSQSRPTAK
jgi:hypothetical protein